MEKGFKTPAGMWLPGTRKPEGGSRFDDELQTADTVFEAEVSKMMKHLNERPDHIVYVGSTEERDKMRKVFNHMHEQGAIGHHPNIRIDYGIQEGAMRIGE